jgi:cysteine desulfurase
MQSRSPVYLDANATTPIDHRVAEAERRAASLGNASSRDHHFGWDAAEAVETARWRVAELIGASCPEIAFTSGATEGVNLALKGFALAVKARGGAEARIVTCAAEHASVLETCRQLQRLLAVQVDYLPVDPRGRLHPPALAQRLLPGRPTVVAVMFANNETGTLQPVREIADVAHRAGALFFCDITQAASKMPVHVHDMGIDLAAFSSHKMYGPKGVGAFFMRSGGPKIDLEALITGGGQERGLRAGTLNVTGIVGFGEACRIAVEDMEGDSARVRQLRDRLEHTLLEKLPDVWVNGDTANRLSNTSNLGFGGLDARTLIRDMHDVAVSTRSACASGEAGPSHVLKAMGLTDDHAYSSVRFSLGRFTTTAEIDHAIERVLASVRRMRAHASNLAEAR